MCTRVFVCGFVVLDIFRVFLFEMHKKCNPFSIFQSSFLFVLGFSFFFKWLKIIRKIQD